MNYKDKFVNVDQYINRREEINIRLAEIADTMEAEKREASESELGEIDALKREKAVIDLKISSADSRGMVAIKARELAFDEYLRAVISDRAVKSVELQRSAGDPVYMATTTTNFKAGFVPLTIRDIVEPLEEGLILSKVGLPLYTGLSGSYVWPVVTNAVEATIAGETVALTDSALSLDKVIPVPTRVGITINITQQAINQSQGVMYDVVMKQLPLAVQRCLNKAIFNTDYSAISDLGGLAGPFAVAAHETATALSEIVDKDTMKATYNIEAANILPSYAELKALKGLVLVKGVPAENLAYVMDAYTAAMLEGTPKDEGSGIMIIQDGKIDGIPVYVTNYINEDDQSYVGFGNFGYLPLQGFGAMRFVVDPYGGATKDVVRLTLNSDWAASTLKKEAFAVITLATEAPAAAGGEGGGEGGGGTT